jgi:hypothetical protein
VGSNASHKFCTPKLWDGAPAEVAAKATFASITITGGVLVDEAMQLFAK